MSEYNATAVRLAYENVDGSLPANPKFHEVRITEDTLDGDTQTVENNELRTDLQKTGLTPVGEQAGGGFSFNLSHDNIHHPLVGVFGNGVAIAPVRENETAGGAATSVVAGGSPGHNVAASAGTAGNSGAFLPGMLVKASGFTNAANNGVFVAGAGTTGTFIARAGAVAEAVPPIGARLKAVGYQADAGDVQCVEAVGGEPPKLISTVLDFTTLGLLPGEVIKIGGTANANRFNAAFLNAPVVIDEAPGSVAAHVIRLREVPAGWGNDNGAGKNIRLFFGDVLRNGSMKIPFRIEQERADLGEYTYYHRDQVARVTLNLQSGQQISGQVEFQGARTEETTDRPAGAVTVPAPTGVVVNAATLLGSLRLDGEELGGTAVTAMELVIEREVERRGALFAFGTASMALGDFQVTGTFTRYYTNAAIRNKARTGAPFSASLFIPDEAGSRAMAFTIPSAQYRNAPRRRQGRSRVINPGFLANALNPGSYTCQYVRFEHVEF